MTLNYTFHSNRGLVKNPPSGFSSTAGKKYRITFAFNQQLLLFGVEVSEGFNAVLLVFGRAELMRQRGGSRVGKQRLQVGLSCLLLLRHVSELLSSFLEDRVGASAVRYKLQVTLKCSHGADFV